MDDPKKTNTAGNTVHTNLQSMNNPIKHSKLQPLKSVLVLSTSIK